MMAAWQVRPPWLVTMAEAFFMMGSQSGSVLSVTRISPLLKFTHAVRVKNHARFAGADRLAHAVAADKALPLRFQSIGLTERASSFVTALFPAAPAR